MPTITTTEGSGWRAMLKEVKDLGLKEVSFFPTCLSPEKRKEFYQLLREAPIKSIPLLIWNYGSLTGWFASTKLGFLIVTPGLNIQFQRRGENIEILFILKIHIFSIPGTKKNLKNLPEFA